MKRTRKVSGDAVDQEDTFIYLEGIQIPKGVTKVVFDSSVNEIPEGAFRKCNKLKEVVLNLELRKIGRYAFQNCTALKFINLHLPSSVKIGRYAFSWCTSLESISLPSTLTEVAEYVFWGCTKLKGVVLNQGLQIIHGFAFHSCQSLEGVILPATVTEVGPNAFFECGNLRNVQLNEGLQKIRNWAFAYCAALQLINLPSTVTEVGSNAFNHCPNLSEVNLNERLQTIEEDSFKECPRLVVLKFPSLSARANILIEAGQSRIEGKLNAYHCFEWIRGELLVSPQAISSKDWGTTRSHLDRAIRFLEVKEITTILELALWKVKIAEVGEATVDGRSACRPGVPGPVKDAILQYFEPF